MHELGVVFKIRDRLKMLASENGFSRINSVTVALGEVSTVIPEYLTDCWDWMRKKEPLLAEAEMLIEPVPAITLCEDCGKTYPTVKYARICPHCGSERTFLVQGNEFLIKEVEVPEPEDARS